MPDLMPLIEAKFEVHHTEGKEVVARCPWHDDSGRPNLYVNSESGLYICFSCGAKGKVAGKMTTSERTLNMKDRLKKLRTPEDHEVRAYPESWLSQFIPHPYWSEVRGFSERVIEQFDLGYDPISDRLVIPIRDRTGNVLGVVQRRLDNIKPKYMHPRGFHTGKHLFGSHLVGKHRKMALTEGPLDAIACWDAGIPALAAYGARLTTGQAAIVRELGIQTLVVMTDNDGPGRDAARSIKKGLTGVGVMVGEYEPHWGAKDPGELTKAKRKQMYHSAVPFHVWRKRQ